MNDTTASLNGQYLFPNSSYLPIQQWPRNSFLLLLLMYPLFTTLLRYDRLRKTLTNFPYKERASFASMTDDDAFRIQQRIAELEFPFIFEKALQFALFRSYGIPSISKLLVGTTQFAKEATSAKRYVDTEVLIQEFITHAPSSTRAVEAISRMNYIHSEYRKAGQILDDDMLYTLSLFAREPIKWINTYEWRTLEDFEKCAIGTFWKSIGDAMGISYDALKSGKAGFIDGLQWVEEITEWADEYEKNYMKPHVNNQTIADQTTMILLWNVPLALKGVGKNLVSALMDERLRTAMMYPAPPQFYSRLVAVIFGTRKLLLRHLALPRPSFLRLHHLSTAPSELGTYFSSKFDTAPFYVKPTIWRRWALAAWLTWSMGLPLPGDDGDRYFPHGYRIGQIGPESFRGKGEDFARESVEGLRRTRTGGCPFGR